MQLKIYQRRCGMLGMYGCAKYIRDFHKMSDVGVTPDQFTAALVNILGDKKCPKAHRLTKSERWAT